jgi:hypothetical protein
MAREHINDIFRLTTFIQYYFNEVQATCWPMRVPSADLNLLYIANIAAGK